MLLDPLEPRVLMAYMYYISPLGNDANSGTSTGSAFRSVARVNQLDLNAGDRVLFQGGQTFSGELDFTQQDSG
ncbi:MAG: beta-glucosidase, partial [Tepidisphaeraceae bacterium]